MHLSMRIIRASFVAWASIALPYTATHAAEMAIKAEGRATLPTGVHRVLVLGDSITYSGTYAANIETYFLLRNGRQAVEWMNLGLSSETVSGLSEPGHAGGQFPRPDLHERLARVLTQTKPDLVIACYGMNDGIYQPLDATRFQAFKDGMTRLHDAVTKAGATILHATPPTYDRQGPKEFYDEVLQKYSDWLLSRRADGWDVVDLHGRMKEYLAKKRLTNPTFALSGDGVHPKELGHWIMAKAILLHLGASDLADGETSIDVLSAHPHGPAIFKAVVERQAVMRDAWLTATGHKRPGVKPGLPLDKARSKAVGIDAQIDELLK